MKLKSKFSFALMILLIVSTVLFFSCFPKYIEQSRNRVLTEESVELDPQTEQLHQSLFIADLHADSLLWDRDLIKKSNYGHVDIPRLIEGNIGLQVFSVVTKTPKNLNLLKNSDATDNIALLAFAQLWPPQTWFSLFERANYQANLLQRDAEQSSDRFFLIKSKQDLRAYLQQRKIDPKISAGLLSLEGAHALEGKLENLNRFYSTGFRIIGFTHFFDNELGGSAHGIHQRGITKFGKQVLQRMEDLNMFVDIAHASPELIEDIFKLSKRPVLVTQVGIQAICPSASHRNLTDKQIYQVAKSGGVIGIGFWPTVTYGKSIAGIVRSIRYVSEKVGVEHVALGSDFDGNVLVPFTSAGMSQLTHALIEAKFTKQEIEKIMGGNVKKLLLEYLPEN